MKGKLNVQNDPLSTINIYERMIDRIGHYAIILLDLKGTIRNWNKGAEKISGYAGKEAIGENLHLLYSPDDRIKRLPEGYLAQAKEKGEVVSEGWRMKKDGNRIWVRSVLTALHEENTHKIIGFSELICDTTEKKKSDEQAEFLSSIVHNIHDTIISTDANFIITEWNKPAEVILGWKKEEVIGRSATEILKVIYPNNDREEVWNAYQKKGFWHGETIYHTKTGKQINMLVTASYLKNFEGQINGTLVLARDITQRKIVENALEQLNARLEEKVRIRTEEILQKEKLFQSLVENDYTITSLIDDKYQTIYRSPSAESILGWTETERNNMPIEEIMHPDEIGFQKQMMKELMENPGKVISSTFRTRHKNGNYMWIESTAVNRFDDPNIRAIVINMHDITERKGSEIIIQELNKNLEEKVRLRTSELTAANIALESFSYSVSHDLQSPIRTLNNFTDIILEKYGASFDPGLKTLFNFVLKSGKRMNLIVSDLLKLAKYGKDQLEITTIKTTSLFQKVWDDLNGITPGKAYFILHELPDVSGDSSMLEQVIINLLSNAVKYSSKIEHPQIEVGCTYDDKKTMFFVKDNGAGFNMEYYEKLFGAFQRLHSNKDFEGTGIGLLLVKQIIENHGGTIWAEGKVDEGATFYFTIPVKPKCLL